MNTRSESKPVVSPAALAVTCGKYCSPAIPPYVEPTAEIAYGCVEWFCYDKHPSPLQELCGNARKR